MTAGEKEIRDAERKAMAEVRKWKRNAVKRWNSMTPDELDEYFKKQAEELRARGINVVPSL